MDSITRRGGGGLGGETSCLLVLLSSHRFPMPARFCQFDFMLLTSPVQLLWYVRESALFTECVYAHPGLGVVST